MGGALLWGAILVAALTAIQVFPLLPSPLRLREGEASPQDILAPRKIIYESQILTEQERVKAEAAVADVYGPPDPRVARQQVRRASQVLDYIDALRHDPYTSPEDKMALIAAIPDLDLSPTVISHTLLLDDQAWQAVSAETLYVLNQTMREEIRENQVAAAKRRLPSAIDPTLPEDQAEIVAQLAQSFIQPNSLYNAEQTRANKAAARQAVAPVRRTIERGQAIVREGDIVTPLELEALEELGLLRPEFEWQEVASTGLLMAIIVFVLGLYLLRFRPGFWLNQRYLLLFGLLLLLFAALAKLMVPGHVLLPYLFPAAAASMLLTVLLGPQFAVAAAILLALVVGFLGGGSLELMVYALAGGVIAALSLWRVERLNSFLWAGVYVALANLAVILAFILQGRDYDTLGLIQLAAVSVINGGLAAGLTIAGYLALSNLFGITTSLQLMELARPTHPLLHELQMKAPGTYHHSILISNMAEQAAQAIGADALLARVGAYYHDIGKTLRPYFFTENQIDGVNVHERLDPQTSAQIIISHVADGLELARKYGLPRKIRDFIPQHHGTRLASFFYQQARENSQEANEVDFRYPGPKPQTREAAIMMLADGVEAAVRANRTDSAEEIDQLVRKIIHERMMEGQLDECDLTLRDLDRIREAFVGILQGIYHPRVKYPEEKPAPPEDGALPRPQQLPSRIRKERGNASEAPPHEQP
ncbi:MAG: HD family phosphohydrolase [Anaerolineae bacterium]